ncbi:MAG: DUF4082 domain-containing protein, partial [Acidobacteria bacterium]|nr:DUF4082 domain-containing protein [Acidobacteriota bacterium]
NIRQATLNLLADMGAQPANIQSGLIPATTSADSTAPISTIANPVAAASIPAGAIVTVSGSAVDAGGGIVAAVEVSTDGGSTWRRASGTSNWSYAWVPGVLGTATVMARATDDSGNIESSPTPVSVTITQANCPCSIWTPSLTVPWMVDSNDGAAVEVGLKFSTDVGGVVNGLRFYKAVTNTGSHVGHLWTKSGTMLATVTFTGESASGWQQANFASPAIIQANTVYVISYFAPNGHYSDDQYFLGKAAVNQWPLHAPKSTAAEPNGVFNYGASGFPSETWFSDSYGVDVLFTPDLVMPTVALTAPANGANISGNAVTVSATASDNLSIAGVQFKIDGGNVGAEDTASPYSIAWNSTLTANGTHTLTAVARDAAGNLTTSAGVTVAVFNADTVPPAVSISSPANSATVHGAVSVVAAASDNQGLSGVQFMVDGALVGSELNAPPYTMTWDTNALTNNSTHTLQARARDTSNNVTTSVASTVTVLNPVAGAPAIDALVSVDQPNNQSTVTSPTFSTTTGNQLVLAFVATDYLGGANTTVTGVTGGGLTWALVGRTNVQAGSSEVWRAFAPSPLTNASVIATLSQAVDSMMTVVSFSNVDTSGTNGSGAIGAIASANSIAAAPTATLTTTRNNSWVFGVGNDYDTATTRTVGANQVLVHQYFPPVGDTYWVQRALNPTPASGTAVTINDTQPNGDRYNLFIVEIKALNAPDVTPPTVSMTAPANGTTVTGKTVAVSATASDNVAVTGVQFKLDGANLGAADAASPYSVTWDSTTASNGSHVLSAIATDGAGNTTTAAAVTVTVDNDTIAPTVAVTAPAAGSTVSATVTVSANASDNVGVVGVQVKLDGANLGAEVTAAPYNVSWNTTTSANGSHSLTAVARDAAGNTTTSGAVTVTVNNVDATPPTVAITAPGNGATVAGSSVAVSATASDNIAVVGVQFRLDGVNLGAEDTASPYSISWNTGTAANGVHSLTAIARDGAGNTATSAVTVTVNNDLLAPTVAMTAPADGSTATGSVTVSANASDNVAVVGVQFLVDGTAAGAEVTTAPYQMAWNSASVANGSHTLSARARDAAGNQTTSAAVTVTVSNVATGPPVVDAIKSVNRSNSATTLVTGTFSTTKTNELLVAFISTDYRTGANTTVTGVTGAGLTWTLVKRTNVQLGGAEIWRAFAPATLTGVTVTATMSQSTAGSMTVVSFSNVDTTGAGAGAIGASVSANSAGGAPTATLITTRDNSLVFGVGNDFDNAVARTVGPNQTIVNQYLATIGDTYWVQRVTNPVAATGTSVTINDTAPAGDRYNLTICEIRSPQ